jgi:hypothetical protein
MPLIRPKLLLILFRLNRRECAEFEAVAMCNAFVGYFRDLWNAIALNSGSTIDMGHRSRCRQGMLQTGESYFAIAWPASSCRKNAENGVRI